MKNMTLGRYVPINSWMHKLDPRFKIIALIIMMIGIFSINNIYGYAFMFIVLAIGILSAKLSFNYILKSMKPMLFMIVFLFIINLFVEKTGYVLIDINGFKIYSNAIINTLKVVFRLVYMIMVTTLLTATTTPLDLTLGIEDLLSPFKFLHIPAHEIAMMISIVLRFIPTLIEDTSRIMDAQASRGVDYQDGSIKEKMYGILSMILPLFISSFSRAEELADAMEARSYYPGKTRTRYKQLIITNADWIFMTLVVVVTIIAILLGKLT